MGFVRSAREVAMSDPQADGPPPTFAVVVPVGPASLEIERLSDLAESLGAYESGPGWFVMIDDAPTPRGLDRRVTLPPGVTPVALHHCRPRPMTFSHGGGLCCSVLMGLAWVQANTDASVLLKLDTDSLIINPFRQRLCDLFDASPLVGNAGAYTRTPENLERTWEYHATTIRLLLRRGFNWRHPIQSLKRLQRPAAPAAVVDAIRAAMRRGYDPGEHCLGGGYAVSRAMLDRMGGAGYLADPAAWMEVDMAEDVMVGMFARAVGMELANFVKPGEVFGVRYQGLPAPPAALVERNYAVIHAVKNDATYDEATIRAFFKARRSNGRHRGTTAA